MNVNDLATWLNQTYPGRNWDQQCQRLVWNAVWKLSGIAERDMATYPTAIAAYRASTIESKNALASPAGAIHYWDIGSDGHVAIELGGGQVLMTGTSIALGRGGQQLGLNYGITTVAAYGRGTYLGWSRRNGANPSIVGKISGSRLWEFNRPDKAMQQRIQQAMHDRTKFGQPSRYNGLIDGDWGTLSIKGIQETIKGVGYKGLVDGIPGPDTCYYVQVYAARFGGYKGAIDRILGPNTWIGFANGLETP